MKHGERMNLTERIRFALLSLVFFSARLLGEAVSLSALFHNEFFSIDTVGAFCGITLGLIFLVPGCIGLRYTLRFSSPSFPCDSLQEEG